MHAFHFSIRRHLIRRGLSRQFTHNMASLWETAPAATGPTDLPAVVKMSTGRKLATIRKVGTVTPIPGADKVFCC